MDEPWEYGVQEDVREICLDGHGFETRAYSSHAVSARMSTEISDEAMQDDSA